MTLNELQRSVVLIEMMLIIYDMMMIASLMGIRVVGKGTYMVG